MLKYNFFNQFSLSKKSRVIFFAIFVGIFLLSYFVGSTYKMSSDELNNFLNEFKSETEGIDAVGIFTHNLVDALPMFVPGFGAGWGCYIGWSTGEAFGAFLSSNPALAHVSALAIFLLSPYGAMELVAYSIAMSRSLIILLVFVRRRAWKTELKSHWKPTVVEIGIVVAILLAAAYLEYNMVSSQGT
jgi:Stage II sporulation protein M